MSPIGAVVGTSTWRMPPTSASHAPSMAGSPSAPAMPAASTSVSTGSGWLISAPSASASIVTTAPDVVCFHVPGPRIHAVPSDGCPAKGSSPPGVKMRMSYAPSPVTTGNVVSLSCTSRAMRGMTSGGQGSVTTHSALPCNGRSVNTSTMRYFTADP